MAKFLLVEMVQSGIASTQRHKDTLRGLGLRHRHQKRILQDTPEIRGMIKFVFNLVKFQEVGSATLPKVEKVETYRLGPVPPPKEKKVKVKPEKKAADAAEAKADKAAKKSKEKPAKKAAAKADSKASHAKQAKKKAK